MFHELEERMNALEATEADDPFVAAAQLLTEAEARALIDRIVALYGRLAELAAG